jgi:hypothetical protein
MSREIPICPVCGNKLRATGVNPDMYYCTKRKIWVSDLGTHLEIVDATVYLDPEGKQTVRTIEIPPYSFTITDDAKQETVVRKIIAPERTRPWMPGRIFQKKIVLTIPSVISLPWNDRNKVLERMKLFILFS